MSSTERKVGGPPPNDPGQPWSGMALIVRRTLEGWSRAELAARLAKRGYPVNQSTICRYELDQRLPTREFVVAVAKLLKCRPEDFANPPKLLT